LGDRIINHYVETEGKYVRLVMQDRASITSFPYLDVLFPAIPHSLN